jgi:hypothetical protein
MNLIERVQATQKTVDAFKGKQFCEGKFDCIQLVLCHARHCGKRIKIPKYGDWESAGRVLRQLGFRTLGEAMDHHFERIKPVRAMAGDLIEMPGTNGFSALAVAVGNGRVIGFHEEVPHADILQPVIISGAWRVS